MATNDFLPFANGGGANVLTQAQYAALTTLLSGGYQSGVANSAQMNKTWRQSSIMAAVLGQFAADYSGNNSVDDGTTTTLEANLVAAIRNATKTGVILADTGAANAYAAVNAPPLIAGTWVDGVIQQVKIAHANTGASTYAPDGLTAIPIYGLGLQPLQGGELALNGTAVLMRATIAGVNSGNPIAVLMECAGGAQQVAPATQSQHAVQLGQATGRLLNVQTFASSGTYTPTPGTTSVIVEVQGGGGSGGSVAGPSSGTQLAAAGSGGAGTYAKGRYTSGFSGATVTIGAGGAPSAVGNNAGAAGGASSFGALLSSPGGVAGSAGSFVTVPAAGGGGSLAAAPTGSGIIQLRQGAAPAFWSAVSVSNGVAAVGGSSWFGLGGQGAIGSGGNIGNGPGAGGSGAMVPGSFSSGVQGGPGSAGYVIVWEYA